MGMFDDLVPQGRQSSGVRGIGQPEELTFGERLMDGVTLPAWMDNLRGSTPYRLAKGMANPVVGTVQTLANMVGAGDGINRRISEVQNATDAQTKARDNEVLGGVAEFAGEVLSPVNAVIAAKVPMAATAGARALQGAGLGAGTAAMQPVTNAGETTLSDLVTGNEKADFWSAKGKQITGGAVAGAILTPALGKLADKAARFFAAPSAEIAGARASLHADDAISKALADTGQTIDDLPRDILEGLRLEVINLAKKGKKLDAAARLRKADFDALGIKGTLGQITRDPTVYAKEKNLQSIGGVGDDLTRLFNNQNTRVMEAVSKPAIGARNAYEAGEVLSGSLKKTDDMLGRHVSGLYREARGAGGDVQVPLTGLAQDYENILGKYSENVQRSLPRQVFEALGLSGGTQKKVFGYDDAENLLKVLNANTSNDRAVNSAISELRGAVKRAISETGGGGPYEGARKAAADRFRLQEAVPALEAAANGSVAPDDFIRRFLINGKTNDVKGLSQVLKQSDPGAWNEARAQIGDYLKRAAFGENPAGDSPFRSQAYMKAIRDLGPNKIEAFFSPQELADIMRVGRVGAYMRSFPADSPVNTSRSAGALMWMAGKVPGGNALADLVNSATRSVKGGADVRRSLAAQVPITDMPLTPEQSNFLARLLGAGAITGGTVAGSLAGQ